MIKLPNLDEMTDVEAIAWYTGEVNRLSKERVYDPEYLKQLSDWKERMNKRLKENRLKGWTE